MEREREGRARSAVGCLRGRKTHTFRSSSTASPRGLLNSATLCGPSINPAVPRRPPTWYVPSSARGPSVLLPAPAMVVILPCGLRSAGYFADQPNECGTSLSSHTSTRPREKGTRAELRPQQRTAQPVVSSLNGDMHRPAVSITHVPFVCGFPKSLRWFPPTANGVSEVVGIFFGRASQSMPCTWKAQICVLSGNRRGSSPSRK